MDHAVGGAAQQIFAQARAAGAGGYDSFYDVAMGFYHAVDWRNEKWLQGLLVAHALLWIGTITTRSYQTPQIVIFFFTAIALGLSERLNQVAAENWRAFSTQNYFDPHGVFAGVVYAAPLLALLFFQLINFLMSASQLLIKQKRHELRHEIAKKHAQESKKSQ